MRAATRGARRKMAEDRSPSCLELTRCTTMLQNLWQEASSGVSAAREAWETVQSNTSTRSEPRGLLEDGGRWRKMAHLVALDCNAKGTRLMVSKQS